MAMKKLETFDGTTDVERFLDRFDFAATVDEVTVAKQASQLVLHLTGSVFDVWKGLSEEDRTNCATIKGALRATYGITRFMAWRKLTSHKIEQAQSLDSSCEDLHKWSRVVTAAGSDPAAALATVAFVEALPAHIAQKVRVLCGQQATKQQVIRAAKDIWDDAEVEVAAAAPARNMQKRQASQISPATNRKCFGCDAVGHIVRYCPAVCSQCGGRRHTADKCKRDKVSGNYLGEQSSVPLAPQV